MQVDVTLGDLPAGPLELRMSRSSPGRYSIHDFAKNVYDVHAQDPSGRELALARPDPSGWTVAEHGSTVVVHYKVYGDRLDGTYLAIDTSHAHLNMPAAIMWARGLDDRTSVLRFEPPAGARWTVATQLHPGAAPDEFTAPNLQYLMDSPVEFGPVSIRQFAVGGRPFRFSLHHRGTEAELDEYAKDVQKIVEQEGAIFGQFPQYEPGSYTFLADYLPYASGDGMEHRNSTVMTGAASLSSAEQRREMLGTVAHEFFHCWNVERIRPQDIEPFDFDRSNMSVDLWLAEGFTQYYGELVMRRAGLVSLQDTARTLGALIEQVSHSAALPLRSAEDMSRMAPFIDGGRPVDRTNWHRTVVSYYPFGGAVALALDLSLRERTGGRVTLDDFMRAMWRVHGEPGGTREGYVDHPYTDADIEARLAEVSGDAVFARDFFARFIRGHEAADYARLLQPAGFVLRRRHPGQAWLGDAGLQARNGAVVLTALSTPGTPLYAAGLDQDDELRQLDGEKIASPEDVAAVLRRHKPGDRVELGYVDRRGTPQRVTVALAENPHEEVVPVEMANGTLTPAARAFREAWLAPRTR